MADYEWRWKLDDHDRQLILSERDELAD